MDIGSTGTGYKVLLFIVRANFLLNDIYDNLMSILFGFEPFEDAKMRAYNERIRSEREEEGEDAKG